MNPDDEMMGAESTMDPLAGMCPWEAQQPQMPQPQMPPLVGHGGAPPAQIPPTAQAAPPAIPKTKRHPTRRTDPLNEGEPIGEAKFKRPCVFYGLGKCRWGSICKYSHEPPHLMVNLTANYQPRTPYEATIKSLTDGSAVAMTDEGPQTGDYEILVDLMKLFRIQVKLRVALAKQHEMDAMMGVPASQPMLGRLDHQMLHPQ